MKFSKELLVNHGRNCPYCDETMKVFTSDRRKKFNDHFPTRDHVIPKSIMPAQGILIVCRKCNNDKKNLLLEEWLEVLQNVKDFRVPIIKDYMKKINYQTAFSK